MLKIADTLLQELIEEMKRQVDFKTNCKNFLDAMLNKKIKWDKKTKDYFDFLHKEKLIHNNSYKINIIDKKFTSLFENEIKTVNCDKYSLSLFQYHQNQVLSLKEASPTFNYLMGKNIGIMTEDLKVPCITYEGKPFCVMPIKEIMHVQKYEKPRGKILIVGVGTGCSAYYYDKNRDIENIDIFEPNLAIKEIFNQTIKKYLSDKVEVLEKVEAPWIYDKIFIYDEFLDKNFVDVLYRQFHGNKKVKFSNEKTLKNNLKLEIFRQLVIFIGDTKTRSEDSEIGKNIYDYFEKNEVELSTLNDFICFIDDNFAEFIKKVA